MYKSDKFRFLTTVVGDEKYTVPIYEAAARNKCVPLMKTMFSSHCRNNCKFCAFRSGRRTRRESWQPEELAKVALHVQKKGWIRGLFLSSSVHGDPDKVVESELKTVRILRSKGFTSYVHLRMMPGVSTELIKQAAEISDRIGINIEFPRAEHYNDMKIFLDFRQDIIKRLRIISREVENAQKNGKCKAGLDSQMVVGASNETDKDILKVSDWLYHKLKARRVYYSSFHPVHDTPLEKQPAENRWREYRLYQSSFLIQKYNFHSKDFVLDSNDKLHLSVDPKVLIAKQLELFVDISTAGFNELIRVPGIGIDTANKIIFERNSGTRFKNLDQLKKLGVIVKRALPFIKIPTGQKTLTQFSFKLAKS
jgi:predicted DNA-binding helix-hairpin-helix protein